MIRVLNSLADGMLNAILPKASADAATSPDCFCCPGGHHSYTCDAGDLYELSCCCTWVRVCGGCCA